MHANRNAARAARHSHRRQNLDERGLFDIPIVGPILSGVLGGGKHTTATSSKATSANNPPAQATTTAAQAPPAQQSSAANNGGGAATSAGSGDSGNAGGTTAANTGDGGAASPTGGDSGTSAAAGGGAGGAAGGGATSQASQAPLPSGAIVGSTTGADGHVTPLATGSNGVVIPVATGSDGLFTPITTATAVMGGETIHGTGSSPTGSTNPSISAESANLAKKGLSGGAVAGILIPILLVIGAIVFFILRRRSKNRRAQGDSSNHWWFGKARHDSDNESNHSSSSLRGGKTSSERAKKINSMRSSFGTTVDHGALISTSPPMAEVSRQRSFGHAGETLMQNTTPRSAAFAKLTIPPSSYRPPNDDGYDAVPETPMSVRPFSPSETFAFPKPPAPASDGRGSPPTRSITPKSGGFYTSRFSGQSQDSTNPSSVAQTYNPIAESHTSSITEESSGSSAEGTLATAHEFSPVEVVRRPFLPTLDDELNVEPGDTVRIVKAFDDGWCFCEKEEGLGAGSRGLIPIDCLREAGQSLPAFLASKRVSSNYATWAIADQLQTISEASA